MPTLAISVSILGWTFFASGALAKTQTASAGNVTAVLSYTEDPKLFTARDIHISITRDGQVLLNERITCRDLGLSRYCGEGAPPQVGGISGGKAIVVRNLDRDSEPEILVDFFTGGASCCAFSVFYDFVPAQDTYARTVKLWGHEGYELTDLDNNNIREFKSGDYRFDDVFGPRVACPPPLQIWSYAGTGFVDVTRGFPRLVSRQARSLWRIYSRSRKRGEDTPVVEGALASYLADQYLLGRGRQGWHRVRSASRTRSLRLSTKARRRYLHRLRRFLERTGYSRAT